MFLDRIGHDQLNPLQEHAGVGRTHVHLSSSSESPSPFPEGRDNLHHIVTTLRALQLLQHRRALIDPAWRIEDM